MKVIISFCAPAVIDNIATTAPTPKIIPSMVSKLRSLCANRLAMPINSSGPILESPMTYLPPGIPPMGLPPPPWDFFSPFFLEFLSGEGSAMATISPASTPLEITIMDSLCFTS